MPTAIVYCDGHNRIKEIVHSLSNLNGWDICFLSREDFQIQNLLKAFQDIELHFLVYSNKLEYNSVEELQFIRNAYPFTIIIYYHTFLVKQQLLKLNEVGINSCIIGLHRQNYLQELLLKLWPKHWKRIPEKIYPNSANFLSSRAKKILTFIENKPFSQCQTKIIADSLEISQSHFCAEFKHNFGIKFREFKQKLFRHYESILLLNQNYKPTDISQLLNYSNQANFNKSLKTGHGRSWCNMSH